MIQPSKKADRTKNPIRNIVDNLKPPVNHPKPFLNLALGDPTLYGNLKCPELLQKALLDCLM
jgi:tyrosine aminotransferase